MKCSNINFCLLACNNFHHLFSPYERLMQVGRKISDGRGVVEMYEVMSKRPRGEREILSRNRKIIFSHFLYFVCVGMEERNVEKTDFNIKNMKEIAYNIIHPHWNEYVKI